MSTTLFGSVSHDQEKGTRQSQEDRFFHHPVTGQVGWFMAVMDGHGGKDVVELCAREIPRLFGLLVGSGSCKKVITRIVQELAEMTKADYSGSTLSIAWVREDLDLVTVAVLGDSPVIVLDASGKVHVSPEHNVRTNLAEREAGVKRGGWFDGSYLRKGESGLQMSRALGDAHLGDIISREPEIYTVASPRRVLVASDGLLDPSHGDVSGPVRDLGLLLQKNFVTARHVMLLAKDRGELEDNTTVLLWKHSS